MKHTPETRDRISKSLTGRKQSESHREANSRAKTGPNNPHWGTERSEEVREKIRQGNVGKHSRTWTEEERIRHSERIRASWERRRNQKNEE